MSIPHCSRCASLPTPTWFGGRAPDRHSCILPFSGFALDASQSVSLDINAPLVRYPGGQHGDAFVPYRDILEVKRSPMVTLHSRGKVIPGLMHLKAFGKSFALMTRRMSTRKSRVWNTV